MIAIGTDILSVARIEQALARHGDRFAQRILAPVELSTYRASSSPDRLLAKRFAAKEAIAKALGTGIGEKVSWQDISISHDEAGAPLVTLSGGALRTCEKKGGHKVLLSLSDERDYVVAFAVLAGSL